MNPTIVSQLDQEIARVKKELHRLGAARAALVGSPSPAKSGTSPSAPRKRTPKRAPTGHLENAIEKLLVAEPSLANGEIRTKLKAAGYEYSLRPQHVGKRLTSMIDDKRLVAKQDGYRRLYRLAK
jgi:hypothetical protein